MLSNVMPSDVGLTEAQFKAIVEGLLGDDGGQGNGYYPPRPEP